MQPDDAQVRILTLNCWGLWLVSKKRRARIEAIARRLADESEQHDIVALQELWVEEDFELVRESVQHYLPHVKRWYSGILTGPGLVVFSRWPIESAWIFRFPLNGRPSAFWRGDWYVGKSAGSCVIRHPCGRRLEVINAHLHAPYQPTYDCHRVSQAWDMAGIVSRAISSGHTVFVTGDLNYRPQSIGLRLFELKAHLSDAWVCTHRSHRRSRQNSITISRDIHTLAQDNMAEDVEKDILVQRGIGQLSPEEQIDLVGVTSDSQLNTWREHYAPERAQRLDYIFFDADKATPKSCRVTFTQPVPDVGSVSDHFGVMATFALTSPPKFLSPFSASQSALPASEPIPNKLEVERMLDDILKVIGDYVPQARRQAFWRNTAFWLCSAGLVGLLVAVWWGAASNRSYVGFIFLVVALGAAVGGCMNGLLGFLFGRNEQRALQEFETQVRLARSLE